MEKTTKKTNALELVLYIVSKVSVPAHYRKYLPPQHSFVRLSCSCCCCRTAHLICIAGGGPSVHSVLVLVFVFSLFSLSSHFHVVSLLSTLFFCTHELYHPKYMYVYIVHTKHTVETKTFVDIYVQGGSQMVINVPSAIRRSQFVSDGVKSGRNLRPRGVQKLKD